jgi:hypothetical protein
MRRSEGERIERAGRSTYEQIQELEAERRQLPEAEHQARAEVAVIDHLIAERERVAMVAARISPPSYITKELGVRPSDPLKRASWEKAVRGIERYRAAESIGDRDSALGPRPEHGVRRSEWDRQQRRLQETLRRLERTQAIERVRATKRSLEIEL